MREGACLGDRGSGQGKGRRGPGLFGLVRGSHYRSEAGVDLGEIGGISVVFGAEGNRRARYPKSNLMIIFNPIKYT